MIAISEAVKRVLLGAGNSEAKITVIPHGVPDAPRGDRLALRRELGIAPEAFALFNAARFIRDKGQDVLLEMMGELGGRGDFNCVLYLVGDADTDFGRDVRQRAEGMDEVRFMGYRDDVQRILPAFDVYVSGARREAFGLSLVEALAAEIPVVATDVGGVAEVVADGETGLLVPSEDAKALAEAIWALRDTPLRATFGIAARKRYEARFTIAAMTDKTEQVYGISGAS